MSNCSWKTYGLAVATLCGASVVSGCGGAYDASVAGVVKLDGKNLPSGLVGFYPVTAGPAAYAYTDGSGNYSVRTGRKEGIPAGEYQVTVAANEPPALARTEQGFAPPPGKAITPTWYRAKETSGLKYTVEPGSNQINIELKSTPPTGWKPGAK